MTDETAPDTPVDGLNTSVPHSARVYNYWLGGKDHYEVDRIAGEHVIQAFPGIVTAARTGRLFLNRAVRYLAGEAGVRQFLDIGTGLPTVDNTHEVAQRVAPDARIVYVDNDPLVLVHARALLTSTPEGTTAYVEADLHDPETILRKAAKTLDLSKPVALMLMGIMGHATSYDEARSIIRSLLDNLPSGSYLTLYDATATSEPMLRAQEAYNESGALPYYIRSVEEIAGYFEGLELVEPGVTETTKWRPETAEVGVVEKVDCYCGVGRKP